MTNSLIKSIKTIAQSLVDNAGYDKTRGGQIVGVNNATNTYSIKIDGITYPNIRAVDDSTYNVGDLVKVVIPCNQATQMYISSSILSDNSLGNQIANATSIAQNAQQLGEDNQQEIADVADIANSKNKIFRQGTAPTSGMDTDDMWIDTSDENKLYIWDGVQWVFSGGGNGQDGLNNATILLYKRGVTAPNLPTSNVTYTFATASLTPISALNGWSQNIPPIDGNPCWVIAATASATTSTDVIQSTEWTNPPIKFVEDGATGATGEQGATGATGATGLQKAIIYLYSRTTTTTPTAGQTYTFATGQLSSVPSGWSQDIPSGSNPCYISTAIAIGYEATATIASWSTPTKWVENGGKGETGDTGLTGVSMRNRGEWTTGQSYTKGTTGGTYIDVVTLDGNTYMCNTSHTSSNANKPPNATYWVLAAQEGATGATGTAPEGVVEIIVNSISYPNQTATLQARLFVDGVATTTGITNYHWYRVVGSTVTDLGSGASMSSISVTILGATYRCAITWS